jgi:hypothetical protein
LKEGLKFSTHQDEETATFIAQSFEKSDWIFTQIYHNIAKERFILI